MTQDGPGPAPDLSGGCVSVRTLWKACLRCGRAYAVNARHANEHRFCSARCRAAHHRHDPLPPQGALFGDELKAQGKALAADRNPEMLEVFRRIARELARDGSEVCIDQVRERAEEEGVQYVPGNWMGSVFNEPGWQFIRFKRATHASAHARPVGVWRLS